MRRKTPYLLFVALFCVAGPLSAQELTQAQEEAIQKLQTRLEELRAQMAEIQSQLEAIRPAQVEQSGSIASTPPAPPVHLTPEQQQDAIGEATEHHQTFGQDEEAAPRLFNAPLEPTYPGFFLLPGTQTLLRLDGSARTDFMYDPDESTLGDSFSPAALPIPSQPGHGNFTTSIRGSRAMADFRIPVGERGSARTFLQFDFFGANGSTAPRLRHFYAQYENVLVGQTFTNFMDPDAFADSLDLAGANSGISVRPPQARYSFGLGGGVSAYVSVEQASSSIGYSIAGAPVTPTTPVPDGVLRVRKEWEGGHFQLAGVFRDLGVKLPDGTHDSVFGWGVNATAGVEVYGRNNIVLGLAYGQGMARYVADVAGLNLDAAPHSQADLSLKALPVLATYGAYQHYWSSDLRSSATFGFVRVDNTDFQPGSTYHESTYSSVNLIWNPVGTLDLGAEVIYGRVENKDGASSDAPRFQLTGRYRFVKLHPEETGP